MDSNRRSLSPEFRPAFSPAPAGVILAGALVLITLNPLIFRGVSDLRPADADGPDEQPASTPPGT